MTESNTPKGEVCRPTKDSTVKVVVAVHSPEDFEFNFEAKVVLRKNNTLIILERPKGSFLYEGTVAPGTYTLEAGTTELSSPPSPVEIAAPSSTFSIYLGKKDWPFYRLGKNLIPFEPHDDLIAVAFEYRRQREPQAQRVSPARGARLHPAGGFRGCRCEVLRARKVRLGRSRCRQPQRQHRATKAELPPKDCRHL